MNTQKDLFLQTEGDAWFERNPPQEHNQSEPIASILKTHSISPQCILEIGCASGSRLNNLNKIFDAQCYGIDPSRKAIETGKKAFHKLTLERGTADVLNFPDNRFDLVIFGFCLYLCDPIDYFRIAWQADRVLRDGGFLFIKDFNSPLPYRSAYSHKLGMYSHKMDWAKMFTWNPSYRLLSRQYMEHTQPYGFEPNERLSIDVLRKDHTHAFLDLEY